MKRKEIGVSTPESTTTASMIHWTLFPKIWTFACSRQCLGVSMSYDGLSLNRMFCLAQFKALQTAEKSPFVTLCLHSATLMCLQTSSTCPFTFNASVQCLRLQMILGTSAFSDLSLYLMMTTVNGFDLMGQRSGLSIKWLGHCLKNLPPEFVSNKR